MTEYAKARYGRYFYTGYDAYSDTTKDGDRPFTWWLSNSEYLSESYFGQDIFTVGLSGKIRTWDEYGYYMSSSEYEGYPVCGVRPKISVVFP